MPIVVVILMPLTTNVSEIIARVMRNLQLMEDVRLVSNTIKLLLMVLIVYYHNAEVTIKGLMKEVYVKLALL